MELKHDCGISAKIIADSVNPTGQRITTMELRYPRFIHSEIMTHRDRARNAASSRAIPWKKMRQTIIDDPVIPVKFGREQRGMQTSKYLEGDRLCQGSGFGHWSPHEHPARAAGPDHQSGPFRGWEQYRKTFENECAPE